MLRDTHNDGPLLGFSLLVKYKKANERCGKEASFETGEGCNLQVHICSMQVPMYSYVIYISASFKLGATSHAA